jgi:hypothetical protein
MNVAVAGWSHAMLVSTVQIIPDQPDAILCTDPKVRGDTLFIVDGTKDGDNDFNWKKCNTESSTTGYDYKNKATRGRHTINFCHLIPGDEAATEAKAIKAMVHELEHVMGLKHEHQRPDRDTWIDLHCDRLDGYDEAAKEVDYDVHGAFDGEQPHEERLAFL